MSTSSSVLFDAPGPRARARQRVVGLLGGLVVLAAVAYVVWRFADTGQFSGTKWSIFQYTQVQLTLLRGLRSTLQAAAVAAVLALALGVLLAVARLSLLPPLRAAAWGFVELFRGLPLVVQIFLYFYGALELLGTASTFGALVLALTLYNGSVLAEIFRAGLLSLPRGQSEAAYALGLTRRQALRIVLLPQAVRAMLPAIISQVVVLLKDTALGFLIVYPELLTEARQLASSPRFEFPTIPVALVVGAVYVSICLALSFVANRVQNRNRRVGRG